MKKIILSLSLFGAISIANADCHFNINLYYFDSPVDGGSSFIVSYVPVYSATVSLVEGQSYKHPHAENRSENYIYCLKNSYLKYTTHSYNWNDYTFKTSYSAPIIISKLRVPTQTQIAFQEATGIAPIYDVDRPNSYFSKNEAGGYQVGGSINKGPAFQISNRTDRLYLEDLEAKNPSPGSQEVIDLKAKV